MGRAKKAFVNTSVGIGSYFVITVATFIYRTIFVYLLGGQYLGMQGLFTNILALLSLAELGIGSSITFSMYKPLAENDTTKIKSLLKVYKRIYRWVFVVVVAFGLMITPFLGLFFETRPQISESLELIYVLFVFNTALSYAFVYKHSMLSADQNAYIITFTSNGFTLLRIIGQIVWILVYKSFIPALLIQLVFTLASNVFISFISTQRYPFIRNIDSAPDLDKSEMADIFEKIKAMFLYRIGAYFVNSTDNILISKFISVLSVGIYSNYTLLLGIAKSLTNYIGIALTPSIGNQIAKESKEKVLGTFKTLLFMYFWLSSTTTILFAVLLNPFIELWIGNAYVLNEVTVLFILINYYILMMRRLLISYRNALGLYVQAKYKPVYESVINIVASLILLRYFGVLGVVIGTTISELATSMWIEPYVLYKHYFVEGQREYWRKYISYFAFTILTSGVLVLARSNVSITDFGFLVVTAVITFAVSNFMIIILFRRTDDYRHAKQDLAKHLKWRK